MNKKFFQQYLPQIAIGLTILFFGFRMLPHSDAETDFHFRDFGRLPVLDKGRYKPMDTVARNNLMIITHRQSYYDADQEKSYPANKWLLDVMTTPHPDPDAEDHGGCLEPGTREWPARLGLQSFSYRE